MKRGTFAVLNSKSTYRCDCKILHRLSHTERHYRYAVTQTRS